MRTSPLHVCPDISLASVYHYLNIIILASHNNLMLGKGHYQGQEQVSKFLEISSGSRGRGRGECLSERNVLHPLSNGDLTYTQQLSYIKSRCPSLDTVGGRGGACCSASEVSDAFVYSAGILLSISLSHAICYIRMTGVCFTSGAGAGRVTGVLQLRCGVYDGTGCTNFFY